MEDRQIVDLYWARSENAISETEVKYGRYCYYIAHNILHNNEDIVIRYYSEAEEGHGYRFRTMLETFSVIDPNSIIQPQVNTVT